MSDLRVDIPAWQPPWPVRVNDPFIRVTASHLRGDPRWECPAQIAAKARPGIKAERDPSLRVFFAPHTSFPLGLVREAAYAVLSRGADPDAALAAAFDASKGAVPEAMRQVAQAGLNGYLIALERLRDTGALHADDVVREFFAYDEADGDGPRIEWSAWGLLHVTRDSSLREFHVLTWDGAGTRERSDAYLAVYARVAAEAVAMSDGQPWYLPWEPSAAQPRAGATVRVREIGLLDSTDALLLERSLDEVRAGFAGSVREGVRILAGDAFNPGSRCASCAVRWDCPGVARMPGLLGVAGVATWTRALTPADLTAGRLCTWQVHLERDLSLPKVRRESTAAMQRGAAIHRWLEVQHGRLQACTPEALPLPADGVGEIAEELGWSREQYAALRPYLLQHARICPLGRSDVISATPEQSLTGWDTDVDVVASTRTDLVLEFPDGIVVRETKTVAEAAAPESSIEVFERYPQVALALCLLADGLDPISGGVVARPSFGQSAGGAPAASPARVELELLSVEGGEVRSFDATDPVTVLEARAVVAEAVDRILYSEPSPNPGPWCGWCRVSAWCSAAQELPSGAADDVDVVADAAAASGSSRVALLAYAETVVGDEDDMPF